MAINRDGWIMDGVKDGQATDGWTDEHKENI